MTHALFASTFSLVVLVALGYRRRALKWETRANHWFGVAMQTEGLVTEAQAVKIWNDLFPKAPSAVRDAESLRAWRERRAITSSDHLTRHAFASSSDREAVGHLLRASGGKPS